MLKHNLLIAFRNFRRYKSSFFINLIGLSTGIACTLLIYMWVNDELNMDKFHAKDARLFQVMEHQQYEDHIMTTTSTPGLLAETLAEEIPEIKYAATTTWIDSYTLSIDDHIVTGEGYDVGPDFFNIFSYNLISGDADQVLADKYSIVISKSLAEQLFGTSQDVIGKQVVLQHEESFQVGGVFEDIPINSSYQFDFVMNFEKYKDENDWITSWQSNGPSTFIILEEGSDSQFVSEKIADFIKPRNENTNVTLFLKQYSERYLYGSYDNGQPSGGRIEYVRLFSIIAAFILLIACINFMNLSTARASRRAKEVGIKKAVGANKNSLVYQYLGESVLIAIISLLFAVVIVWLFMPEFNEITGKELSLNMSSDLLKGALIIVIITGLLSGSYPAVYLSSFKPSAVMKGEAKGSIGELWARKGLVIFQFTLSIILIVAVTVVYNQIEYVQNKNLGYNNDNILYFDAVGNVEDKLDPFLTELKRIPGVKNASSIGHQLLWRNNNTSGLEWEGKDPESRILFENVRVNYDMLETLDLEFIEGRSFSREYSTDTSAIIFNEAAIKILGFEEPIGKVIKLWGQYNLEIIGVVKNFHFQSLHNQVNPLFFVLNPENTWFIMSKIESGKEKETIDEIQKLYAEFNPGFTFDYRFLDQEYENLYQSEQRVASLSQYFSGFAILISCLGLFGLASFTAQRRLKEIGIRKALGSSEPGIILLLSKDFTILVLISILIAIPISYLMSQQWLTRFAFRIDLQWWFFIGAGILSILIAWLTVGFQAFKAARVSPVDCLKEE